MTLAIIPLQVVLPLIAAPLCAMTSRSAVSWLIAVAATWTACVISIALLFYVLAMGTLSYPMGGWLPPIGIEYRVDILNAFVLVIVSSVASIAIIYARDSIAAEVEQAKQPLFYTLYLLCLAGLLGMTITNDVFNIYVFLEISSLATYTLIAMGKNRKALVSAFEYLILGTIGATFYLIGIGLLYMMTGTLNASDLAGRIHDIHDMRTIVVAFSFITIGLALKFALFPLHAWLCNAYTYAPTFVSSFLAATGTKVCIYVFIRMVFMVFGERFAFEMLFDKILMVFALFAIFAGSISAIFQKDIKRMLAYSSVAQIGYIILGISLGNDAGLTSAIVHLFNHALAKAGLFLAVGCVAYRYHGVTLDHFRGMGHQMPFTMGAFVILALSLIGVPTTAGFISKWMLLVGLMEKGLWPVVGLVVISSALSLVYCWRVIEYAYFKEHPNAAPVRTEAPLSMLIPTWIFALFSMWFGLSTQYSLGIASKAASSLLGGSAW
jgi:multicomponent Na+:H+ antiporter subunit D